eukprot:Em0015g1033a
MRIADISSELGITPSEALEIVRVVTGQGDGTDTAATSRATPLHAGQSVLTLLQEEESRGSIVTFCAKLDEMLGGGLPLGKITEPVFSSDFPVFCVLVSCTHVNVQTADTEGSFVVQRLAEIAQAAKQHIDGIAEASNDPGYSVGRFSSIQRCLRLASEFTLERILSGIHCYRSHSYLDLVAIMNVLPEFIGAHPQVKLVVIDSIAAHFRHGFECMSLRNRILGGLSQSLILIATRFKLAVLLTNQMTTRVSHKFGKPAQLVPALGDSWGHSCTLRVILHWSGSCRFATLVKSPSLKEAVVSYQITGSGVRDVDPSLGNSDAPNVASQEDTSSLYEDFDTDDVTQLDEPWEEEGEERSDIVSSSVVPSGHLLDGIRKSKRPCLSPLSEL